MVKALGIFLCQILGKDIMTGAGQTVAAHTAIVMFLIGSLTGRAQTHNDITGTDVGIVYHVRALHAAGHSRVYDDRTHQVAHIGGLTTSGIDANTHLTHLSQQLVGTVDDGRDYLARHQHLVTADGARHQDVVDSAHTQQVVSIHHDGILGYTLPHIDIAGLLPVHVGQRRFGSGAVGVHDVAIVGVTAQDIGDNLAEGLWEYAFVYILDGIVHIFFGGTYATHHISVVCHCLSC